MTTTFLAAALLSVVAFLLYYDFRFRRHWTGYMFGYPLKGFDRQLFLTFDDGPSRFGKILKGDGDEQPISDPIARKAILREIPEYDFDKTSTENLLDLLKRHRAKAIFFVWGKSVEACPVARTVIGRMSDEGHQLGNHSFSHLYSRKAPISDLLNDFASNHDLLKAISGKDVHLFRPPYGDWEPDLTRHFLAHPTLRNYAFPIFWTNVFRDWALKSSEELATLDTRMKDLTASCGDRSGKILLLHDTYVSSILLTAKILNSSSALGYSVGDPADLASAAERETSLYRRLPFLYYLKNLGSRVLLKLSPPGRAHTNYEMEQ